MVYEAGITPILFQPSYDEERHAVQCRAFIEDEEGERKEIAFCNVNINPDGIWMITEWRTDFEYRRKGIGKEILKTALYFAKEGFGEPVLVQYVWDGQNPYVLSWLEKNFGAVNLCPSEVKKNDECDDWEAHMYMLDKSRFLAYFGLRKAA